jgi:chromosome segregation ATPase
MSARLRPKLIIALLCIVIAVTASGRVPAAQQSGPGSNDVMSALLQEVHGLRMAMEQSAAIAPRVQLTLARLNIEEQRIAQLATQFDRARQELGNHSLSLARVADELEEAEKQLQVTVDEKKRRDLEMGVIGLRRQLKALTAAQQAARTQENDASQALTTEQNRWLELNTRLDELERLLTPVR